MQISIIAAVALNDVIGCQGKLPWQLSADLKRFRELTLGKPVIMGRKTWESLPRKPLPNRINVVISSDPAAQGRFQDATVVHSLESVLNIAHAFREVFIIGGGEIYRQALPLADRVHLTRVNLEPEGDVTFPEMTGFRPALIGDWQIENGIQFRYETHVKEGAVNVQTAK
ncbi:hypothetical protein TSO5_04240 [Azospirillum sp. TSO5]|nr:hypothetical protein TSO5_04240 [Azospirillum sp. TSO5]